MSESQAAVAQQLPDFVDLEVARRLHEAALAGCEYAVVSTQPGSGSQSNMERRGFRVAYTNVVMMRESPEIATAAQGGANGH